jgi:GNAT superfamily N-acetyltransferase
MSSSSSTLPPPYLSDLPASDLTSASDPLATVPSLTTSVLTEESDITAALKLTADSIAQQRQAASRALIFSPAFILVWSVLIGTLYKYTYHSIDDIGMMLTTGGGLTMAMLAACKLLTGPYLVEAEKINFGFLDAEDGEEDTVIGTKFGDEVIGTCIVRFYRPASSMVGKKRGKNIKLQAPTAALIRAWTVRLKYRHKDVGTGLLEEAVKLAREKGGKDVKIGFAKDHANSRMVVPEMFNGGFRRGQEKAVALLEKVEREIESSGKGSRRR